MAVARLRFYAELNDYLPVQLRQHEIAAPFTTPCPVRHLIETWGVPHTEIELILIDGTSVDFEAHVQDGDRISIYPVFESVDVTQLVRLRPRPLREPRFLADAQLGRLARYLRLLGFDTRYENAIDDRELVRHARDEHRIILSRDLGLMMRREVTHGCHIRTDDPIAQLVQVIRRCDLTHMTAPFTRCMECNGGIDSIDKAQVAAELPARTSAAFDAFWRCRDCRRIYWKGSHYQRLEQFVSAVLQQAGVEEESGRGPC